MLLLIENIFPRQGENFPWAGNNFSLEWGCGRLFGVVKKFRYSEGAKRDKRDRRDSENRGVGSGRYSLIIYIIYILYNNKQ